MPDAKTPPDPGSPARPGPTTLGRSAAAATAGRPYLGDPEAVGGLVGDFIGDVIGRAVAASLGETTRDAAKAGDVDAARAFMAVIAGRDRRWTPVRSWNAATKGGLKSWLRARLAEVVNDELLAKEPDGPYEAVAAYLLAGTYDILRAWDAPEDELRDRATALREDVVRLLLGIAPDPEGEAPSA